MLFFGNFDAGGSESNMSEEEVVHITDEHKLSRLLYPNPVCMLTTNPDDTNEHPNAMVLSWLSPANNKAPTAPPLFAAVSPPAITG